MTIEQLAPPMVAELERGLEYLREAEGLARRLDDPRRLGWASAYMISSFWLTGRLTDGLMFAQTAQAIAETLGDLSLRVLVSQYLGAARWNTGDYQQATELFRKVTELLKGDLSRERFGQALLPAVFSRGYLAHSLAERGAFDEAIAEAQEGIRIAEAVDHPYSLSQGYRALGYVHGVKGELNQAIPFGSVPLAVENGASDASGCLRHDDDSMGVDVWPPGSPTPMMDPGARPHMSGNARVGGIPRYGVGRKVRS